MPPQIEWLLVCLLALITSLPVLLKLRRYRSRAFWTSLLGIILATGGGVAWNSQRARKKASEAAFATTVPRPVQSEGYVSSSNCRSCHPSEYSSWHETFHRTMTQIARPGLVLGSFEGVVLELNGETYVLKKAGDEFWAEMPDPDWKHDPKNLKLAALGDASKPPRLWKRIGLLTGSHHMQIYWVTSRFGNMQTIFPFAWLIQDRRWVPVHETFLRDPKLPPSLHLWNVNCLKCHATGGQPRPDPVTHILDTRVGELGIACEACHGPAQEHIQINQSPWNRYRQHWTTNAAGQIANPVRKAKETSSHICGQCHGIKWIPTAENFNQNGFRYRPGDNLNDTTPIVRPSRLDLMPWLRESLRQNPKFLDEHYWSDGEVRVSGREFNGLVDSACYERGNLSCVSCHSMHQSDPDDQLAAGKRGNQACLQCHTDFAGKIQDHTHHAAGSAGSECYNCHMPHTTYGLLKAIRSHRISSPSVKTNILTGRPNACNLCHLDQSLDWTAKHLSEWYHTPAVELSGEQQEISAALLGLLRGDAGQRALAAWSMGWEPAVQASGQGWLAPFLAELLDDPYSAVRYIAYRSLRRIRGFEDFKYDFVGPATDRATARTRALEVWRSIGTKGIDRAGTKVLVEPNGALDQPAIGRLLRQRDDRSMDLQE